MVLYVWMQRIAYGTHHTSDMCISNAWHNFQQCDTLHFYKMQLIHKWFSVVSSLFMHRYFVCCCYTLALLFIINFFFSLNILLYSFFGVHILTLDALCTQQGLSKQNHRSDLQLAFSFCVCVCFCVLLQSLQQIYRTQFIYFNVTLCINSCNWSMN